jgi:hypothetical protein
MDLVFRDPGFQYSIDSIMMFQSDEHSDWWRESLFMVYPQMDREHFDSLCPAERKAYMEEALQAVYEQSRAEISDKIQQYREHWIECKPQVEAAFKDAFGMDVQNLFNDIHANITLNPVSPRFLAEHTFDIFYKNSKKGALGVSLHELIHFLWFNVWQECFADDPSEYESPSLKWVFSEMAVDPIMRDQRLSSINPYFEAGCAYEYFYTMKIDEQPILDTLFAMYKSNPVREFMRSGYKYCMENEKSIRRQMR